MQHLPIEIIGEISSFLTEREDFSNFLLCSKMIFPAKETVGAQKRIKKFQEENEEVKSVLDYIDEYWQPFGFWSREYANICDLISTKKNKIKKLLIKKNIRLARYMFILYPSTVDVFYFALDRIETAEDFRSQFEHFMQLNIDFRDKPEDVYAVQLKIAYKFGLEIVRDYFPEVLVSWDPRKKIWRKRRIYKPRQTKTQ